MDSITEQGTLLVRIIGIMQAVEEGGVPNLSPAPPPTGVCQVHLTLTTREYCGRKLLHQESHCYWHAETAAKYSSQVIDEYFGPGFTLKTALEAEVASGRSLELVYLAGARLEGNFMVRGCDLKNAVFVRANLKEAHFSHSSLEGSNFAFANLEKAYLSSCEIKGARFVGARLFDAKFRDSSFSGVVGLDKERFRGLRWGWLPVYRLNETYPDQCEEIYRSLTSHLSSKGLLDDASWAAYRSCVMRHRVLTQKLSSTKLRADETVLAMMNAPEQSEVLLQRMLGISARQVSFRFFAAKAFAFVAWVQSLVLLVVVGYGEKPARVLLSAMFAILGFALIYQRFNAINDQSFVSCLYFSAITFTTVGYGDLAPHGALRLIAASEALTGILLCGMFLFCLGRRTVARA
jgi:uncharacterized protein YjbI with pentapeptide repeats